MRIVALDISSKTGWAVYDDAAARPLLGTKPLVGWGYDEGTMLEHFRKWLGEFIQKHNPQMAAVERPFIPTHGGKVDGVTVSRQHMLCGMAVWAFGAVGIQWHWAPVPQWRSHAFGSARNNGTDWKVRAKQRCDFLGWEYPDDNAAEAGLILDWLLVDKAKINPPWRDDVLMQRLI